MKIILDTNIIVSDFRLKSPDFQVLLENSKKETEQLIIPQVVVDEVLNKFKQRLELVKSNTEGEIKTFNKLTTSSIEQIISSEKIEQSLKEYKSYLDKIFKDNNVRILPYPATSHQQVAKRAMHKKKPFNYNGAGYRDSLIWENIKSEITQDEEILILPKVVFITNNYKDFATKEFELHPDLLNELNEELYNTDSIIIYSGIKEYVDKKAKNYLKQEKLLAEKLKDNKLDDLDLHYITTYYLFDNFIGYELDGDDIGLPQEYENPSIISISEDYEIDKISVKRLTVDKVLIDVSFELEVYIDFYIFKADYWGMEEENEPSIVDSDWNKHYMLGETTTDVQLSMSILVNTQFEVLSCQINKINKNYAQQGV